MAGLSPELRNLSRYTHRTNHNKRHDQQATPYAVSSINSSQSNSEAPGRLVTKHISWSAASGQLTNPGGHVAFRNQKNSHSEATLR